MISTKDKYTPIYFNNLTRHIQKHSGFPYILEYIYYIHGKINFRKDVINEYESDHEPNATIRFLLHDKNKHIINSKIEIIIFD